MARVYISSTYEDLVDLRKAAIEAARRLDHQPVGMEDYGAFEAQPAARCVADVHSCDAYVGILGWRYGFMPQDETRSITRLEYEAAGAAGIPRLLFLSPGRDTWNRAQDPDATAIDDFRQDVQAAHGVRSFTDGIDLRTEVMAALGRELQPGRRSPPLLPYFCDRFPQRRALQQVLYPTDKPIRENAPLLFVLHGDQTQSHGRFIDCLKQRYVADIIQKPSEKTPVKEYQLNWPKARTSDAFVHELIDRLSEAVCRRPGLTKDAIATGLSDIRDPVLLTLSLPISQWNPGIDGPLLDAFARFWAEWSLPLRCWPTIVLLHVQYPTVSGGVLNKWFKARKLRRSNEHVESAIDSLSGNFMESGGFAVSRLSDVPKDDALAWARSEEVKRVSGDADVEVDVRSLYDAHAVDEMPMEPLGKALKDILQRYFTKGS